MLKCLFGGAAQVIVGVLFFAVTIVQSIWWLWIHPPTVRAIFVVSMEALAFAAYGIIATGLGFRATERVEAEVTVKED